MSLALRNPVLRGRCDGNRFTSTTARTKLSKSEDPLGWRKFAQTKRERIADKSANSTDQNVIFLKAAGLASAGGLRRM